MALTDKLKAIGDQVRNLMGSTEKLSLEAMASKLNDASGEVTTQASLIAQISEVLEGKAAGGGGSSSGGSSSNVATIGTSLPVRSTASGGAVYYTRLSDGVVELATTTFARMTTSTYVATIFDTCICNTPIVVISTGTISFNGATELASSSGSYGIYTIESSIDGGGDDDEDLPSGPNGGGPIEEEIPGL